MATNTNLRSRKDIIKFCSINICGLSSRSRLMIDKYNHTENFDAIFIQESGKNTVKQLQLNNMKMILDTNKSQNRGAALYVNSDYTCTQIKDISRLSEELDSTWGLAVIKNKRYIVGSIYVKLNLNTAIPDVIKMLKAAQSMTGKLRACGILLFGDFNARHTLWGDEVCNTYGKQLFEMLNHSNFSIVNSKTPTFLCENGGSHIDLMITSKNLVNKVEACFTDDDIELFSGAPIRGHVPLIIQIGKNGDYTPTAVTEKLDVNSINWTNWSADLEKEIHKDKPEIDHYEDPEKLWEYTDKVIKKVTMKHGVLKKSTKHSKPFWTNQLTTLCNKMRSARKAYKKRNTDERKQNMIKTKEEFDQMRKEECEKFILDKTKTLNAADSRKFWVEFNKIFKKKSEQGIDPLEDGNGGLITDTREMEEKLFNTFFQCRHMINADFDETFYDTVNELYDELIKEGDDNAEEDEEQAELNSVITISEIKKAIKRTDPGKISLDDHQMHPKMLHNLGDNALRVLHKLFNLSMNKTKWVWSKAEVIFLKKDGKDSYAVPGSYRPISISSYIGKLLEKILAARIVRFLIRKNQHDPDQEGFTEGRNTIRYLNRLHLEIKADLLEGKTVVGFFVDMEKAFDSVWKKAMIIKLSRLEIKGNVLRLVDDFLKSRVVKLHINGEVGESRRCEEYGLPQGSALSPILFKIYLIDILEDLKERRDITVFKFADDGTIKISAETTDQCIDAMKAVIESLESWTKSWRMIINCNPNKTEYICFSTTDNSEIPDSFKLSDKHIKRVTKTKVLGLTIDDKLSYKPHSIEVNKKLMYQWARICQYTNIHWGLNQNVMTRLINTLFISIMQYAGHIWMNKRNMEDINHLWYKLIKTAVGATFNIKLGIGEVIIGVPPISIQTSVNQTKHYLKLNINQVPEDKLRDFVKFCLDNQTSQPAELKLAMKEVLKFLMWKSDQIPGDFTDEDIKIVEDKDYKQYFNLSPKSCSYTKSCIKKYTEKLWYNKIRNESLVEGEPHIVKPSCMRIPIPTNTTRADEVSLMSLLYPQNLMNSFVYRHTYCVESPMCPQCRQEEQTPYHVICECNQYSVDIRQCIRETVGEEEARLEDTITLLNCSRQPRFIELCLQVIREGDFRREINLEE